MFFFCQRGINKYLHLNLSMSLSTVSHCDHPHSLSQHNWGISGRINVTPVIGHLVYSLAFISTHHCTLDLSHLGHFLTSTQLTRWIFVQRKLAVGTFLIIYKQYVYFSANVRLQFKLPIFNFNIRLSLIFLNNSVFYSSFIN